MLLRVLRFFGFLLRQPDRRVRLGELCRRGIASGHRLEALSDIDDRTQVCPLLARVYALLAASHGLRHSDQFDIRIDGPLPCDNLHHAPVDKQPSHWTKKVAISRLFNKRATACDISHSSEEDE